VFVGGVEETLFPSAMSINTREELEEERRLFYVAVTRAKQRLWLTYSNSRYRFGQLVQNEPSRFIEEMPEAYIDKSFAGGNSRNNTNNWGGAFERMHRGFTPRDAAAGAEKKYGPPPSKKPAGSKPEYLPVVPPTPKVTAHIPSADFAPSDTSSLEAGQRVEHQKFGFGTVSSIEGSAHNPVATILFEKNGEKKIMLNYAKLRIIP
jgi:DNA helicase-2/ATP-dependent DNA helicase PcrA